MPSIRFQRYLVGYEECQACSWRISPKKESLRFVEFLCFLLELSPHLPPRTCEFHLVKNEPLVSVVEFELLRFSHTYPNLCSFEEER